MVLLAGTGSTFVISLDRVYENVLGQAFAGELSGDATLPQHHDSRANREQVAEVR